MRYSEQKRHSKSTFTNQIDLEPNTLRQIAWLGQKAMETCVDLIWSLDKENSVAFVTAESRLSASLNLIGTFDIEYIYQYWPKEETGFGPYFRRANSALQMSIFFSRRIFGDVAASRLNAYPNQTVDSWEMDGFSDWRSGYMLFLKTNCPDIYGWSKHQLWEQSLAINKSIEAELKTALESYEFQFENYFSKYRGNGKSYGDSAPTGNLEVLDPVRFFLEECDEFSQTLQIRSLNERSIGRSDDCEEILIAKVDKNLSLTRKLGRIRNSLQSLVDEAAEECLKVHEDPKPIFLLTQAAGSMVGRFLEFLPEATALLRTVQVKQQHSPLVKLEEGKSISSTKRTNEACDSYELFRSALLEHHRYGKNLNFEYTTPNILKSKIGKSAPTWTRCFKIWMGIEKNAHRKYVSLCKQPDSRALEKALERLHGSVSEEKLVQSAIEIISADDSRFIVS